MEAYELLATPVRDTAIVSVVKKINQSMYTGASNGAIREWTLAHNAQKINFAGALQLHSGWINDFACSKATFGTCAMHGIVNHCCLLYSSSDDRNVYIWDIVTRKKLAHLNPPNKQCGTMRNMALSTRHLFIGSSTGIIYIYPFEKVCERKDRHECSLEAGAKRFCLQGFLQHGVKTITDLVVGGKNYEGANLFSASEDGTIAIFALDDEGYDFEIIYLFDSHKMAVTSLALSWSHLYSASDDGTIRVWCLSTFDLIRVLHCGMRVKCIFLDEHKEKEKDTSAPPTTLAVKKDEKDEDGGQVKSGYLYAGLANGYVQKWRIGTWM
jgi:WD40 repeat protein